MASLCMSCHLSVDSGQARLNWFPLLYVVSTPQRGNGTFSIMAQGTRGRQQRLPVLLKAVPRAGGAVMCVCV